MKTLNTLVIAGSFFIFSNAFAEGGGDKAFEKMMIANTAAMEKYAARHQKEAPVAKQYTYGMKMDVVKVVSVVRPAESCAVVPAAMTYEDSEGKLNTVTYTVAGDCSKRGG